MDFSTQLSGTIALIDDGINALLPPIIPNGPAGPGRVHEAMRYAIQAGGKRLRPVLVLAAARLFARSSGATNPMPAAVAIECLHTYSLIHDDLPGMDNDDLRRGRPTAHKQFDEATAILAGDALLTHAFALLARHYREPPALGLALIDELAAAAGSWQLIGGQMEDMLAEGNPLGPDQLEFIHANKTAAMIRTSLAIGGRIGGASDEQLAVLRTAGHHLGVAFQIIDDILDATADTATLGKTAGKDARAGKSTFVALHGLDASRRFAREHTAAALGAIGGLPGDKTFLNDLTESMAVRAK